MHWCPELPGTRSPSEAVVNRAVAVWSLLSWTTPALQVLPGLPVVPTNAAWEDCQTRVLLATRPTGTAAARTVRRLRGRVAVREYRRGGAASRCRGQRPIGTMPPLRSEETSTRGPVTLSPRGRTRDRPTGQRPPRRPHGSSTGASATDAGAPARYPGCPLPR